MSTLSSCLVDVTVSGKLTNANGVVASILKAVSKPFTDGTGADQANHLWGLESQLLNESTTIDFDLYDLASLDLGAGAGEDMLGNVITISKIKTLLIVNEGTGTLPGNLIVGNNGTTAAWLGFFNADAHALTLPPEGVLLVSTPNATGMAVTDVTSHLLRLAASAGDCTYSIYVIGID